jgi:hypothetical protein
MPVLAVRYDCNTVVHRVQFGFLALASCTGAGWVFADRQAHPLRAFTPLKVIRPFFVALLLPVDDHEVWFYSPVCGEHNAAIPPSMRCLDSFSEIDFAIHR